MPVKVPLMDDRNQKAIVEQLRKLIHEYCPEWKDAEAVGADPQVNALIHIFASMMESVIERLNKAPEKNFLAFLDLLGIQLKPPRVARTPLVFKLAEGASLSGLIPAGTQVATEAGVVFETAKDLMVILPNLVRAVSVNPKMDRFTDHSPYFFGANPDLAETLFEGKTLIKRRLYLGHRQFFGSPEPVTVKLKLELANSPQVPSGAWEVQWFCQKPEAEPLPLMECKSGVGALLEGGVMTIPNVSGIAPLDLPSGTDQAVDSLNNCWIYAELVTPMPQNESNLPKIKNIQVAIETGKVEVPYSDCIAFFNNTPVDLSKDFYPFGERPRYNDTFYLGSSLFGKEKAIIALKFNLTKATGIPNPESNGARLSWEYWNGQKWIVLNSIENKFTDSTNAFTTTDSEVSFICPPMQPLAYNGAENYWIRVRLADGDYGQEAEYLEQTVNTHYLVLVTNNAQGEKEKKKRVPLLDANNNPTGRYKLELLGSEETEWIVQPPTFKPPLLQLESLTYQYVTDYELIEDCLTENYFVWENQKKYLNQSFIPFKPETEEAPSLYLGFNQNISTLPVSLFFPLLENPISGFQTSPVSKLPVIIWEYWNGAKWTLFNVTDETCNLMQREMLQLNIPGNASPRVCFGEKLYWIRACLDGEYLQPPRLKTIYTNTVWSFHHRTVRDEILGSGNGNPNQAYQFSNIPVLSGQKVYVRETALTDEERVDIIASEGEDAIVELRDEGNNLLELWVRWHEIGNFHFSGTNHRHYALDRNSGQISFGDGVRGKIPPLGKDNIQCRIYCSGGGVQGNVGANQLTKLRTTIPYIAAVTNPIAADGGGDQEDLERAKTRGPQVLKHRDRAVTYEDFEWLAREANPKVAKVKCLPVTSPSLQHQPGWNTLIVVPESDELKPLPSQELLTQIKEYLYSRSEAHLVAGTPQISLIGPGYLRVGVQALVRFEKEDTAKITEAQVIESLRAFFHPLHGGLTGQGWDFGRPIYLSEVFQVIENVAGVDYVEELSLRAAIQLYTASCKTMQALSYPRYSKVSTLDGNIRFRLAESVYTKNVNESQTIILQLLGYQEGDRVMLQHQGAKAELIILDIDGEILNCEPMNQLPLETAFPLQSSLENECCRTFILNEIPKGSSRCLIKVALLEAGDEIRIQTPDLTESTMLSLEKISPQQEKVYLSPQYLPYSGEHLINQ